MESPPWRRILALLSLTLIGFVGTALPLRLLASFRPPEPIPPPFSMKAEHLRQSKTPSEVVLLGSSRVHNQIDPSLLDSVLAAKKLPLHSYNLGFSALTLLESTRLLQSLYDEPGFRPKVVLMEATLSARVPIYTLRSARTLQWHDPQGFRAALRLLLGGSHGLLVCLRWGFLHTTAFLGNIFNFGTVANKLFAPAELAKERWLTIGKDGTGFVPFRRDHPNELGQPPAEVTPEQIQRAVATHRRLAGQEGLVLGAAELNLYNHADSLVKSRGGELLLLALPSMDPEIIGEYYRFAHSAQSGTLRPLLLFFAQPDSQPDLFRRENFRDFDHLYQESAGEMTRLIGARLADQLVAGRTRRP